MLEEITAQQFDDWLLFANVEPFGPLRDDFRAGKICAAIMNSQGGVDGKTLEPADFFGSLRALQEEAADGKNVQQGLETLLLLWEAEGG